MDRYAHRLHDWLESTDPGFEVRLAASIGDLTRERAHLGRLSAVVGPGRGSDEAGAAGSVARAAALRRPLRAVSLVAAPRGEARAAGAHPRPQLCAHGDARAAPPGDRHRARPDARHHPALAHRRLARRRTE